MLKLQLRCTAWAVLLLPLSASLRSTTRQCNPTVGGPLPFPFASLRSSLFATHYHGLTQEPALAALVQLGHMEAVVDPRRGLLPSYRLAPGGGCSLLIVGGLSVMCQMLQSLSARHSCHSTVACAAVAISNACL